MSIATRVRPNTLSAERRHCYVTHLVEDGWDPLFVQQQAGHEYASTTAVYTCVSSDFRTRTLRAALDATARAVLRPGKD
jgi:integrase/recombinase XerC